jgi:acetoacetate decarboxylase
MGYVKTSAEVEEIQQLVAAWTFVGDQVSVEFETTPEFVEYILPPCLEPPARPTGFVNVSRWQSALAGEFDMAWVGVLARYGEIEGAYTIQMLLNGDTPIAIGREWMGEVKKRAEMGYFHDGPHIYGFGARHGVRVIEVNGLFGIDEGPAEASFHTLEIKAFPAAEGRGLEYDPLLIVRNSHANYRSLRRGSADITLRGTEFDPLDTVPVVSIGEAVHTVGETRSTIEQKIPFANRADYLPYVFGRHYDDLRLFPSPARYTLEQTLA